MRTIAVCISLVLFAAGCGGGGGYGDRAIEELLDHHYRDTHIAADMEAAADATDGVCDGVLVRFRQTPGDESSTLRNYTVFFRDGELIDIVTGNQLTRINPDLADCWRDAEL